MGLAKKDLKKDFQKLIEQLKVRSHILRYHGWFSMEIIQKMQMEHKQFIEGLKNNDLKLLNDLARRHIRYSKDSYLLHLKTKKANFSKINVT